MNISHSGKKQGGYCFMCAALCVCYIPVAWNDPSQCAHLCICFCVFAYLLHELVCVCTCVQLGACVNLAKSRLAPMWGSISIIPARFTYHFTELYVHCKQRSSPHANELVSLSLHNDSIHCRRGVLPPRWTRYPRLQAYFEVLCAALLSLNVHNSSFHVPFYKYSTFLGAIIRVMTNTCPHKCHVSNLPGLRWTQETRFISTLHPFSPSTSCSCNSSLSLTLPMSDVIICVGCRNFCVLPLQPMCLSHAWWCNSPLIKS